MAATIHIDVATVIASSVAVASLTILAFHLGERLLGTPPPGVTVDKTARVVAAAFVVFLGYGIDRKSHV